MNYLSFYQFIKDACVFCRDWFRHLILITIRMIVIIIFSEVLASNKKNTKHKVNCSKLKNVFFLFSKMKIYILL